MGFGDYVELGLGKLLSGVHGHDKNLVTRQSAFASTKPTLTVSVDEIGPSGSTMDVKYTQYAAEDEQFPTVSWEPPAQGQVAEYAFLVEDPDVPIPTLCPHHAILYGIPKEVRQVTQEDLQQATNDKTKKDFTTKAGWKFVPNLYGKVVIGPRPPLGHVPHRYFFTVVALSEKIDQMALDKQGVSKASIVKQMDGKVLAWGEWIGVFETGWQHRK